MKKLLATFVVTAVLAFSGSYLLAANAMNSSKNDCCGFCQSGEECCGSCD